MKKTLIAASLVFLSGSVLSVNAASTGTITFNGQITDTTCDVNVNGQGANATVTLPTVPSSTLTTQGMVTGRTNFNMQLTNCTLSSVSGDTVSKVSAYFQAGATVDPTTGHLKQQSSSGATNVSLQLIDGGSNQPIKAGDASQSTSNTFYNLTDTGGAVITTPINLPYAVEYFADGKTTPGVVTSSVVYNLQYQ